MKKLIGIILLISMFSSCSKDNTTADNSFNKENYPIKVGNWWKYRMDDVYYGTDTLTLKVLSSYNKSDTIFYLCDIFNSKGILIDTGKYTLTNNYIEYRGRNSSNSYLNNFNFKFPFKPKDFWFGPYRYADTIKVIGYADSAKFFYRTYRPIYTAKRIYEEIGSYLIQDFILSPNVGLVNMSYVLGFAGGIDKQRSFALLEYNVK